MVLFNYSTKELTAKVVYYGPGLCGKTTNLQVLHQRADARRRGEMISVNSAQDRTILFDFMPLKAQGFRGFDVRLQLVAVPGQVMYAASRRVILAGVDAIGPGPGNYPNTDSYKNGNIVQTGITISDVSASGASMTFCLNGCGSSLPALAGSRLRA